MRCSIASAARVLAAAVLVLVLLGGASAAHAAEPLTLTAAPPGSCYLGDTIVLTAGPAVSGYDYQFREGLFVGPGYSWTRITGFRTDPVLYFTPSEAVAGRRYMLEVIVRDRASRTTLGVARLPYVVHPTRLRCTAVTATSATVAWDPVPGAVAYELHRLLPSQSSITVGRVNAPTTTWTATGLWPATTFAIRLAAIRLADGTSLLGPELLVNTDFAPGTVRPTLKGAITAPDTVALSWTASPGASGYHVDRSVNGASWQRLATVTTGTHLTDAGLAFGRPYAYRVRAYTATTYSSWSPAWQVTLPEPATLPAPTATAVAVSPQQVVVQWDAVAWATGYEIERANGLDWILVAMVTAQAATWTDQTVAPGTHYYYRVRARTLQTVSPWSERVQVVTPIPSPGQVQVTAQGGQYALTWSAVTGATAYRVETAAAPQGPWANLGATMGTSYNLGSALPTTTCYYRVVALSPGGESPSAPVMSCHLAAPALLATPISDRAVSLAWTPSMGAVAYEVQCSRNGIDWTITAMMAGGVTRHTVENLAGGTAYWFRVRAAGMTQVSPWSPAVRLLTMPNAPANARINYLTPTSVRVAWSLGYGATATRVETSTDGSVWVTAAICLPTEFTYTLANLPPHATFLVRLVSVSEAGSTPCAPMRVQLP